MPTPVSLKEYFAAAGSRFTKADAEIIGPQVEALAAEGDIDERSIVDTARSTNSPLHRFYEWDNEIAGDKYRLIQAGEMLRAIKVRVMVDDRPKVMPAYRLVSKTPAAAPVSRGYNVLHEGSAFAAKVATSAYDDLVAWRAKYGSYLSVWVDFATTFQQVANQISEFEDCGRPVGIDHETDEALQALVGWRDRFGNLVDNWGALAEQGRFMVEAIDEAEPNHLRLAKSEQRPCLRCGAAFTSTGVGNRMCQRCSARS